MLFIQFSAIIWLLLLLLSGRRHCAIHLDDFDHQFNAHNQYTVDQLLVRVPSVLEEPDTADSNIDIALHRASSPSSPSSSSSSTNDSTNNQNVYQQQQNDLIGSNGLLDTVSEHNLKAKSNSRYRSIKRLLAQIAFNCSGRAEGYYADVDFDCHIFHYCKRSGFKFTFICPGSTVFLQEELSCQESPLRDPAQACRESAKYYFLNSMLYAKNRRHGGAQSLVEHSDESNDTILSTNSNNYPAETSAADDKDNFGKWVTYIATGTVVPVVSSTPSESSVGLEAKIPAPKPKRRNKPRKKSNHNRKPPQSRPTPDLIFPNPLEKHSSELSVSHAVSTALPESLLTSPAPPMEQIDTPKWFPDIKTVDTPTSSTMSSNQFNNNASINHNDLAHNLEYTESGNIYNNGGHHHHHHHQNPQSMSHNKPVSIGFGDRLVASPIANPQKVVASSYEVTENVVDQQNGNRYPTAPAQDSGSGSSRHKIANPFQVDWDDDDQMLVEDFQHQHRLANSQSPQPQSPPRLKTPITLATGDQENYLFGKPMLDHLPEEHFSPVEFETLLKKIPFDMSTLPLTSSGGHGMRPADPQMMIHFPPPPHLHMINAGGHHLHFPLKRPPISSKSQFKLLFDSLVGGGGGGGNGGKIGRRWFGPKNGDTLESVWPWLAMDSGGGGITRRSSSLDHLRHPYYATPHYHPTPHRSTRGWGLEKVAKIASKLAFNRRAAFL